MALVGEAGDVTDLDQQPGRTGRPDAMQAEQPGTGALDQGDHFLVRGFAALIDPLEILDQFECDPFAGGADTGASSLAREIKAAPLATRSRPR